MKLQRTPLILLISALVLGGVVFALERQKPAPTTTSPTQSEPLFSFKEADVKQVRLTTPTQKLAFEKVPAAKAAKPAASPKPTTNPSPQATNTPAVLPSPSPVEKAEVWQMTEPKKVLAEDAAIAFLLNQLATGTSQQKLTIQPNQLAEFGFDKPTATVEVTLADQKKHRIVLGKPNFNRSGIYAQIDPPTPASQAITVYVAPIDLESAVTRSLTDWQAPPPGAASPTPTLSPAP